MAPIKAICFAESPQILLQSVVKAFRLTMSVKQVDFFFINPEAVQHMTEQAVKFSPVRVQTQLFHLAHPMKANEPYKVLPKFTNFSDVTHGRVNSGSVCVWPMFQFENQSEVLAFI